MGKKYSAKQPPFLSKVRITIATESNPPSFISAETQLPSFCTEHKARSAFFLLLETQKGAREALFFFYKKQRTREALFFFQKNRRREARFFFFKKKERGARAPNTRHEARALSKKKQKGREAPFFKKKLKQRDVRSTISFLKEAEGGEREARLIFTWRQKGGAKRAFF